MRPSSTLITRAAFASLLVTPSFAQITVDGTIAGDAYGAAVSVQTVQTQFGDNASELNAAYGTIQAFLKTGGDPQRLVAKASPTPPGGASSYWGDPNERSSFGGNRRRGGTGPYGAGSGAGKARDGAPRRGEIVRAGQLGPVGERTV